jgi:hypothetical protein
MAFANFEFMMFAANILISVLTVRCLQEAKFKHMRLASFEIDGISHFISSRNKGKQLSNVSIWTPIQ